MGAKSRIVKYQKLRDTNTKKCYNGESSPYWEFVGNNNRSNPKRETGQEQSEYPTANPDVLSEFGEDQENLTRKVIKRDWREIKFSKREQQVLVCLSEGLNQVETARKLRVKRTTIQKMIERIKSKGAKWYVVKMANSGLYSTEEETE
jgi:ATP/maltotriose-dependent transcriptional regulator MalT